MSQSKNKVRWCLNKAKKEVENNQKHRGLVEVPQNIEESKKHILKAEHNFKAVISFQKTDFSDWAISAVFYTIYHCFLAIIIKFGYESRNQECTIALVEFLKEEGKIDLSKDIIENLKSVDGDKHHQKNTISLRENFQYGTQTSIDDDKMEDLKRLCKKAISETKNIIYD